MRTIQASKARTHFYSILDEVERGETLSITRKGKPIARLVPYSKPEIKIDRGRVAKAIADLRALRERIGKVSFEEILSARDDGRC